MFVDMGWNDALKSLFSWVYLNYLLDCTSRNMVVVFLRDVGHNKWSP